jgi:hypothetical protein
MGMTAQLQEIKADLETASARLERLYQVLSADAWTTRPPGGGWSPAECVAHLNRTSDEFLPLMREALRGAKPLPAGSQRSMRRGLFGWLLWAIMPPPVRFTRSKATAPFLPSPELDVAELRGEFGRLQRELVELLESTRGQAIDGVYIASPFNARVRYNLFACLGILARHEHRHLWQAERAAEAAGQAAR